MTSRRNIVALFDSILTTQWRGLSAPKCDCYEHLDKVLGFDTGAIWNSDLLRHIEATKLAADEVCESHEADCHGHLLNAWQLALEGFYRLPRAELRPDDLEAYKAFERLAVRLNSRVWLDT